MKLQIAKRNLIHNERGQATLKKQQGLSKLKGLMTENGITYRKIAQEICMEPATFSNKVNGKALFNTQEIQDICDVLNITRADIGMYFFTE
jgi:transcriptional regulator with XRE-family HTH domain